MNKQLLKKYFTILFVFLLAFAKDSKATHLAAADIFVKYAGVGFDPCNGKIDYTYEITLIVYRDCTGTNLPATNFNVSVRSSEILTGPGSVLTPINVAVSTPPDPIITDQLCPVYKDSNTCRMTTTVSGKEYPGYWQRVYKGTVVLPGPQSNWTFSWTSSARNGSIQNIVGAGGEAIYVEAVLNNVPRHDRSTPEFKQEPLPYLCNGVVNTYANAPYDPDGDSLVTVLRSALGANINDILTYNTGYDYLDPVGSNSTNVPFILNPISGVATFRAPTPGAFVLAFRCDKYERGSGVFLGSSMRDVQVNVYKCDAPPPPVDTIPVNLQNVTIVGSSPNQMIYACPGSNIKFDVNSETPDASNMLYMRADNVINLPGSTFTVAGAGTNKVTGTFEWTVPNDIKDYNLTILSLDSTCRPDQPILLSTPRTYIIRVVPGLDAGDDIRFCQLNDKGNQLFVRNAENLRVSWTDIDGSTATLTNPETPGPLAKPLGNTNYVVTTPDLAGNCKSRDTVLVAVNEDNTISITPPSDPAFVLCRPEYIQLEAKFTGKPPLSNLNCGTDNPITCTKSDSVLIYGSTVYGRTNSSIQVGPNAPTFPNEVRSVKQQFLIRKKDLIEHGFRSATINGLYFEVVEAVNAAHEYSNFTIALKCTPVDTLTKKTGFSPGATQVFTSPAPVTFPVGWQQFIFDSPYSWDTTQNLIIELTYKNNATVVDACVNPAGESPILRYVPTAYTSALTYKPADNVTTDVTGAGNPADAVSKQARPLFGFTFCEAPSAPLTVKWTPTTYLSDAELLQPLAYVPKSISYTVETFGRNGCIIRDTFDVYVPEHKFIISPMDTIICFGETVPLPVRNGFAYKWYEYRDGVYEQPTSLSCKDCSLPIAQPKLTTEYRVVVYDSVWCADTLIAKVNVLPLPATNIINKDTVIKYGSSIQLLAAGAKLYNWMPSATLDNPNVSYPIATPTKTTKYVLGGIGNNGCRSYDTLTVHVDNRDDLLVPTAFSPNGDGKNDRFRVANLTFQRLQEFRVFNRWGQEVFSGLDNKGWDGTWKGKQQEIGTYQYVIRVAFPDGFVETYKGDVTLVK